MINLVILFQLKTQKSEASLARSPQLRLAYALVLSQFEWPFYEKHAHHYLSQIRSIEWILIDKYIRSARFCNIIFSNASLVGVNSEHWISLTVHRHSNTGRAHAQVCKRERHVMCEQSAGLWATHVRRVARVLASDLRFALIDAWPTKHSSAFISMRREQLTSCTSSLTLIHLSLTLKIWD